MRMNAKINRGTPGLRPQEEGWMSYTDIARLLGISPQAVDQGERRAIRALWRIGPALMQRAGSSRVGSQKGGIPWNKGTRNENSRPR